MWCLDTEDNLKNITFESRRSLRGWLLLSPVEGVLCLQYSFMDVTFWLQIQFWTPAEKQILDFSLTLICSWLLQIYFSSSDVPRYLSLIVAQGIYV